MRWIHSDSTSNDCISWLEGHEVDGYARYSPFHAGSSNFSESQTMHVSRRGFLAQSSFVATGFVGLQSLIHPGKSSASDDSAGYGELQSDADKRIDLPKGFCYRVISTAGEEMADGFLVPGLPDGMGAFADEASGLTVLIRNHELTPGGGGPFGKKNALIDRVPEGKLYDAGRGMTPGIAGTTTVVYDTQKQQVVRQFLSLAGTYRNCAGGPTPWGTWITCEETNARTGFDMKTGAFSEQDHGFSFEVPVTVEPHLADPVPLKAMGRLNHEAIAVNPKSGVIYETEDRGDGCIYRFIADRHDELRPNLSSGKLQALAVKEQPRRDTRNHNSKLGLIEPGDAFDVEWIDLDDVESPDDDLRHRAFKAGAAMFARGEGIWFGDGAAYFACTSGGQKKIGQIWKYTPSPVEGSSEEAEQPGHLELFIEPNDSALIENADNLTVAPSGELFVCEDRGTKTARLIGVTPSGQPFVFAACHLKSELAGATFSPDGSTLFFNLQKPGLTIAVTGPWHS